ncbi:helix-turn-helix transcriptional regulator [Micromonospora sp. LHW51205]|uniref:helix-turn-helix domain-containing protein n=1 Tax=Micromonospora sp. LHW51205 TaxID=2248752 RepID=UPI00131416EB|nr:helix-turn-helix transcriptional regulator [Micromonospora sp. LHW51205]
MRTVDWPEREAFIAHLDRLKQARGIRYDAAIAEMAEFHPSVISNWRSGKQRPSLSSIVQLADALDVDKYDLAARAGVAEGLARASVPTQLPDEIELLIDQWQTADPNRRVELLARVQFVTEWFEATTPRPGDGRARRAG